MTCRISVSAAEVARPTWTIMPSGLRRFRRLSVGTRRSVFAGPGAGRRVDRGADRGAASVGDDGIATVGWTAGTRPGSARAAPRTNQRSSALFSLQSSNQTTPREALRLGWDIATGGDPRPSRDQGSLWNWSSPIDQYVV